jgi:hypothetical protein
MQENNKKKWREGRELTFKLSFCPFISSSHFKCNVPVANFALPLQALPSVDDGVSAKWGEVGRREEASRKEVGRRKNFGAEKRLKRPKTLGRGGWVFGSSSKQLEWPHLQLVHWWVLVHSSPQLLLKWRHLLALLYYLEV